MTPEERIALNISLYQRFLGHEGHDIRYEYLSDPWLSCMTCEIILRDLTPDGNAIFALLRAVEDAGWDWWLDGGKGLQKGILLKNSAGQAFVSAADTPHEAVIAAIAQIPEAQV